MNKLLKELIKRKTGRGVMTFVRMMTVFLLVLIIPTTAAVVLSFQSIDKVEQAERASYQNSADSLVREFSRYVTQAHNFYYKVGDTLSMQAQTEGRDYAFEYTFRQSLSTFLTGLDSIRGVYCFFPAIDYVISNETGLPASAFVSRKLGGDMAFWQSVLDISGPYAKHSLLPDEQSITGNRAFMTRKIQRNHRAAAYQDCVVVIEYDLESLARSFASLQNTSQDFLLLSMADPAGTGASAAGKDLKLLAAIDQLPVSTRLQQLDYQLGSGLYRVFSQDIQHSELRLSYGVDQGHLQTTGRLRTITTAAIVINILLFIWISVIVAYRSTMPIGKMLELIEADASYFKFDTHGLKDDEVIPYYVSNVRRMREMFHSGAESVRDLFLERLVAGEVKGQTTDIQSILDLYDIRINWQKFMLVLLVPQDAESQPKDAIQRDKQRQELLDALLAGKCASMSCMIIDALSQSTYLILLSDFDAQTDLASAAPALIEEALATWPGHDRFTFSPFYSQQTHSLANVGEAYSSVLTHYQVHMDQHDEQETGRLLNREIVTSAIELVTQEYMDPSLNVDRIAHELHVTQSYLSRSFKKSQGTGLLDFLHSYRIAMAKNLLLREGPVLVKEIAERCGYINDAAFIRVFKKQEGMTPGQFREKQLLGLPLANEPADQ